MHLSQIGLVADHMRNVRSGHERLLLQPWLVIVLKLHILLARVSSLLDLRFH